MNGMSKKLKNMVNIALNAPRLIFTGTIILCLNYISPQNYIRDVNPFTVLIDGVEIEAPFTGGLNQPDPRFIDWNEDGILDCFINDRDGFLQYWVGVATVIPDTGHYIPQFELITKSFQNINVGAWYAFYDFDGDGDADLLSHTQHTVNVSYWMNNNGQFELVTNELMDIEHLPVYGGQIVIPAIADINNDGYTDYFVGDISGRVAYYEGHEFHNGLPQFELITNSFEDIWIVWTPGRHGANAFEFFDMDNDSDLDLIWGDFYQPGLFYLENYGTATHPDFEDSLMVDDFPSELTFETTGRNIARMVDFDNDGDGDMVVGVLSGAYGIEYLDNLYYFQNNGNSEIWNFELITSRLLPGLDFISSSHPALSKPCNEDHLRIWIGNEFNPKNSAWSGGLVTLESYGDSYEYLSLKNESIFQLGSNLSPGIFENLTNSNSPIKDLFIGDFNGTIYKIEEVIPQIDSCAFQDPEPNFLNIDLSGRATPSFGDVDQDGDDDLIIGDKDGYIHVYWNRGTPDSTAFDSTSSLLVDIGDNAAPCVLNNGHILGGNKAGELYEIIYLNSGELFAERRLDIPYVGRNLAPAAYYKEGQTEPDLIFGTQAGGLQYFRYDSTNVRVRDEPIPSAFSLGHPYPNPFNNHFSFTISSHQRDFVNISLVNLLGQKVQNIFDGNIQNDMMQYNVETQLPSGIYFILAETGSVIQMRKILLIK